MLQIVTFFRTLGQVDDMYHAIIQSGDKNSSTPIIPGKTLDTVPQSFSESDRYFNCCTNRRPCLALSETDWGRQILIVHGVVHVNAFLLEFPFPLPFCPLNVMDMAVKVN